MGQRIRTLVLVTLVTLLVWAFAEGESLRDDTRQNVRLRLEVPRDLSVALSGGDWNGAIKVLRIQGPTTAMGRVLDRLAEGIELVPGRDVQSDPGDYTINLREVLSRHPVFANSGVSVLEVDPPTLSLVVDRLTTVDARVVVPLPTGQSTYTVEALPATVRISLPQRLLNSERFRAFSERPEIFALVDHAAIEATSPSTPLVVAAAELSMDQELAAASSIRIEPRTCRITVRKAVRTGTKVLPAVPVHIRLPAVIASMYTIEVEPDSETMDEVTLSGPSGDIDKCGIGTGFEYQVFAEVELLPSDLEAALANSEGSVVISRVASCDRFVPTTVTWNAPNRVVRLRITRNTSPAGADGGQE